MNRSSTTTIALGGIFLSLAVAACDTTPKRDATGETTITGDTREEQVKEDLDHAGEKLGEAAKKVATDVKEEAKEEWKKLDVRVETNSSAAARDAGPPSPRIKEPAPKKR